MINEIKTYWVADNKKPTKEDFEEAVKIARSENAKVQLHWGNKNKKWHEPKEVFVTITPTANINNLLKYLGYHEQDLINDTNT